MIELTERTTPVMIAAVENRLMQKKRGIISDRSSKGSINAYPKYREPRSDGGLDYSSSKVTNIHNHTHHLAIIAHSSLPQCQRSLLLEKGARCEIESG